MGKGTGTKVFTLISGIASVTGLILQLVGDWADDKRLDQTIDEKVHQAVIEQQKLVPETNNPIGFADTTNQSEEP